MSAFEICQWIQDSQIGTAIRESTWVYPIVLAVHVLALGASVGTILWFDLRLLGLTMRSQPVSAVYRQVAPWMAGGFAIMFLTGGLLFWALAARCYGNVYFRIKVAALVLLAVNALVYHTLTQSTIADWDAAARPPMRARLAGIISMVLWVVTIAAGRRIVLGL
jgi:hypothetical protein